MSWQPVAGATSYNLRYSLFNGGPYTIFAATTTNLNYVVGGLTNGQTYYFVVTAIQAGIEGFLAEQVAINPLDTSQTVRCAGSMSDGGQFTPVVDISSSAPALGQPSYLGAEQYTGLLNLRELDDYGYGNLANETVGTKGYIIYNWSGFDSHIENVHDAFSFTPDAGWININYLERQYKVDNLSGTNYGVIANPLASIYISVTDTNYHYLTVVSPAQFNNPRQFTMRLTSTNNTSAKFAVNEPNGYSHVFQFLFKGDVTLWADATGGSGAIMQALFLDDAPVTYAPLTSSVPAASPVLTNATLLSNGAFKFSFGGSQNASFTVLSATNILQPLSDWTVLGGVTEFSPGEFQFTDPQATSSPSKFYRLVAP